MSAEWLVAELVKALAWPFAVLVIVLIFRGPISNLIDRIRKFTAAGVSIDLDRRLAEAKAEAERVPVPPRPVVGGVGHAPSLDELALLYPGAAILEAWVEVEKALLASADKLGVETRRRSPASVLRALLTEGSIAPSIISLIDDLRGIRNQIAHPGTGTPRVTQAQAYDYLRLAERVLGALPGNGSAS